MNKKDKLATIHRLGLTLQKIIEENKKSKSHNAVVSLRKLAAASEVEYSIIQKISAGKKDPQFTTLVSIAEGFDMSLSKFLLYFETISEESSTKALERKIKKKKN